MVCQSVMAGADSTDSRNLDQTPTWAVAIVVAILIIISLILEKVLHWLGKWFTDKRKMALYEALEKVKGELIVLGFISLLLTFFQDYIGKICISLEVANSMLPCPLEHKNKSSGTTGKNRSRLLWNDRRFLAAADVKDCGNGYVPLISKDGVHQLHVFIFFLAVFHVLYSAIIMTLGRMKIRRWKHWEKETSIHGYEFSHDPSRFRFTHETSFVKSHSGFMTKNIVFFYISCFFQQFFRSVRKSDYLTMRHGFINVHLAPGSKFDFQKYIKRSLEDDFKVVVGISPVLWATVVVFLLLNVAKWHVISYASLVPFIIIVAVGTKLQAIINQMALDIQQRHAVVQGIPLVQVSDKYFWFSRPSLVLFLIHFILFQNAFQITYFFWIWYKFCLKSCFHKPFGLIIARICVGVVVQFMCSYITLPLYALVTQMGSNMKKSIFDEQTSKALKNWHATAVRNRKKERSNRTPGGSPRTPGASPSPSMLPSVSKRLKRSKTTGHAEKKSTTPGYSDTDMSDFETELPTKSLIPKTENDSMDSMDIESGITENQIPHEDFSFVKKIETLD